MSDRLTIPAACLEALGGLRDEDPPVLMHSDAGGLATFCWHPLGPALWEPEAGDRILVQQSAPALIAVLERVCPAPALCDWLMDGHSIYSTHDWSVVPADLIARCVVAEAIRAHGSDPGWTVEVLRG